MTIAKENRSGQVTVTTAGTAVQGPNVNGGIFSIAPAPANTGIVYFGADSSGLDVSATTGYPLSPGESVIVAVDNLSYLWFDATVNGEKACWLRIA